MPEQSCSNCGGPLGVGPLEGLCPRCLVAGDATSVTTRSEVGARAGVGAAVGVAARAVSEGDSRAAGAGRGHEGIGPDGTDAVGVAPDAIGLGGFGPSADAAAAAWVDRPPAPRIDGYELLRELTRGGQGVVYLALQRSTKRKVAIKVLLAGSYASRAARRRFEREIELAASLKHPNIIPVFDSGLTADGGEYYVMDYVRGVPATTYVRDRQLTLEETLALFATICDAVSHAHHKGVIHRDLKPSNVLVDADGNVRVLDFGLAKALTDPGESQVSVTGDVIGTLPYMSPEQTRGNPDEMDTRTDVYALGVMLYEMLTGHLPYPTTGTVADVIRNITEKEPGAPSKAWTSDSGVGTRSRGGAFARARRPGSRRRKRCPLDFDVETIVLKALAKDRDRRYDSAGQFARDVRRYLAGEQIVARRASAWYQFRVFARRNKPLVGAAAAVLLVLVVAVAAVSWQLREVASARGDASRKADAMGNLMALGGDYFADRNDWFTARRLYATALDQTTARGHPGTSILMGLHEVAGRPEGALPLLGSHGRGGGSGGFRGHTQHAKNVVVLSDDTSLTAGDDGRLVHFDLRTGRTLQVVDLRATRRAPRGPAGESLKRFWLSNVAVSPDEKWAAVGCNTGDVVLFSRGPSLRETGVVLQHPDHEIWMVALAEDLRVLTGTNMGRMTLWDGKSGQLLERYQEVRDGDASVAGLAFWPVDPRFALSGCGDGNVRVWDLRQKAPVQTIAGEHGSNEQVNCVAFSRDGTRAVSACFDHTVIVWDVVATRDGPSLVRKKKFEGHEGSVWRAAFSPDGHEVASGSDDGTVRVWDAAAGAERLVLRGQAGRPEGVAFWGEKRLVCTGDGSPDEDTGAMTSALKVWDVGGDVGVQARAKGRVTAISVDDDGVASLSTDAGPQTLYAGEDGVLHASRPADGPAAAPALPQVYAGSANPPRWGEGGRSIPAPQAPAGGATGESPDAGAVLVPLSGGRGILARGPDGKLQLFGTPNATGGAGGDAGGNPGASAGRPVLLRTLIGHKSRVDVAAVSANGRFIVSADSDGTVRVWDVMRPARCRELERQLKLAYDSADRAPAGPFPAETLRAWYAFCGHDVPLADLRARVKEVSPMTAVSAAVR